MGTTLEWIELYNSNNFEIDLLGWKIQDIVGTTHTFTINSSLSSTQSKISANGFLLFKRPETNIMLNNDADGISLLSPDNKVADTISYTKAPLKQSYNRFNTTWSWSTIVTPTSKNITNIKLNIDTKALSNTKNSVKNDGVELGLADLSQNINLN